MAPFHKHGFLTDKKHEILEESDKKLIQEMCDKPKNVVYNSRKAAVEVKHKHGKVKIISTLKPKYFDRAFAHVDASAPAPGKNFQS